MSDSKESAGLQLDFHPSHCSPPRANKVLCQGFLSIRADSRKNVCVEAVSLALAKGKFPQRARSCWHLAALGFAAMCTMPRIRDHNLRHVDATGSIRGARGVSPRLANARARE